jgi:hypothetical protein
LCTIAAALKLNVDAASIKGSVRSKPHLQTAWMTLAEAATLAATRLGGKAIAAEIDAIGTKSPHYDVDVRLRSRQIARVKVDPLTSQLGWRLPPIVAN